MSTAPDQEPDAARSPDRAASPAPAAPDDRRGARRLTIVVLVAAAAVLALDQVTKQLALTHLSIEESVPVLGEVLRLTLVFNPGAAFSLGTSFTPVIAAIQALIAIAIVVASLRVRSWPWALVLGGLLGGALGNLTDRLLRQPGFGRGHVVDFLQLPYWPVFNVADIFVVACAIGIVLISMTGRRLDGTLDTEPASRSARVTGEDG